MFTGVSGSGKSSLVFDTIAAESQRLINETYSAFAQGFIPTLARPQVDVDESQVENNHGLANESDCTERGSIQYIFDNRGGLT